MVMLSEDVAREITDNIGNGPDLLVGENNRAVASMVWTADRRMLVELMSAASTDSATKQGTQADAGGGLARRSSCTFGRRPNRCPARENF